VFNDIPLTGDLKYGGCFDQLRNNYLLKKESAPWCSCQLESLQLFELFTFKLFNLQLFDLHLHRNSPFVQLYSLATICKGLVNVPGSRVLKAFSALPAHS
jgi:hypothetical protein